MTESHHAALIRRARARFIVTALGMVVIGVFGYIGFTITTGSSRNLSVGLTALAAGTGFAAFFSPCSFPLLLTFLARRSESTYRESLFAALRMAFGATILLGILAIGVMSASSAISAGLGFETTGGRLLRVGVAVLLVTLGLRQSGLWHFEMGWFDTVASWGGRVFDRNQRSSRSAADVSYGFGYLLAGFG